MPEGNMPASPAEALAETGSKLQELVAAITQDPQVPDGAKAAFAAALDAFSKGTEALQGGGAEQEAPEAVTMEQGASGAKPQSMQRPQ